MLQRISILGVPIDRVTREQTLLEIASFLSSGGQHHVMTPNPEMLVEAGKNPAFRDVLSRSALNVPDGVGLLWASRWLGTPIAERVAGVDLFQDLCLSPSLPSVYLLGAAPGVAERVGEHFSQRNPSLRIVGTESGSPDPAKETGIIQRINASCAQVLFVAFGAPGQDMWIARNLPKMPGVRLAMGVGGSFDFVAGVRKRAPAWLRSAGLEWFWRLIREPRRFRRIVSAVLVFPLLVLRGGSRGA
ncbi:MAG: WecB/TagA/CpsF family glycosyltransferase [Candidatus Peribacteraceae bacterium]